MPDPARGGRTILLIDEDARTGRLVRLALHGPACQVITCTHHLEGLRLAVRQKPDLILMETRFKGADGLHLGGKLLQAPETQACAVAFLTAEPSLSRRVMAIQMGACEYLVKPVEGNTLSVRVAATLARLAHRPRGPVSGPAVEPLRGELLRLEAQLASGTVSLQRGSLAARIVIAGGEVQLAECGALRDEEALNEIASRGDWVISVSSELGASGDDGAVRNSRITDQTMPATGPVKHVRSALAATVMETPSGRPVPVASAGAAALPEFGWFTEDERTIVDPAARLPDALRDSLQEVSTAEDDQSDPSLASFDDSDISGGLQARITAEERLRPVAVVAPALSAAASEELTSGRPLDAGERARLGLGRHPPQQAYSVQRDEAVPGSPALAAEQGESRRPPGPGEGFEEDLPTAMNFKIDLGNDPSFPALPQLAEVIATPGRTERPTVPGHPAVPAAPAAPNLAVSAEALKAWLAEHQAPLLVVSAASEIRHTIKAATEQLGFTVQAVATGLEAYTAALQRHPVAILSDQRGPELDGRELLAAIRSDFHVRETPFIMISSDFLATQLANAGPAALAPILNGLKTALAAQVNLGERLKSGATELSGWVEPVGSASLLRALASAGVNGTLELAASERSAAVVFRRGEVCAISVDAAGTSSVGGMALLNLLGYEWTEYKLTALLPERVQVPLGRLDQLIETAFQQNNLLLARVYQQGFSFEDLGVDWQSLEQYTQKLPLASQDLGQRLASGERPVQLVEKGLGTPGLLKSIVHELRRKAVLNALSMRAVRGDSEPHAEPAPLRRRRVRWLVIAVASLITVLCAVGGYFLYLKLGLPD